MANDVTVLAELDAMIFFPFPSIVISPDVPFANTTIPAVGVLGSFFVPVPVMMLDGKAVGK